MKREMNLGSHGSVIDPQIQKRSVKPSMCRSPPSSRSVDNKTRRGGERSTDEENRGMINSQPPELLCRKQNCALCGMKIRKNAITRQLLLLPWFNDDGRQAQSVKRILKMRSYNITNYKLKTWSERAKQTFPRSLCLAIDQFLVFAAIWVG